MLSRRFWRGSSFRAWSRTDRQLNRPGHRRTEPIGVDLGRTPGVLITDVHTSRPLRVINQSCAKGEPPSKLITHRYMLISDVLRGGFGGRATSAWRERRGGSA